MSDTLIKVQGVSKKFCRSLKKSLWYGLQDLGNEIRGRRHGGGGELRPDEFWAVKDVSFELKRGECLGLIGHNGAGKTTLLRMLNGLIKPDAGRIEMRGRVGALIALGAGFNPILTGRENIYVNASVLGLSKKEIDAKFEEIVEFAELGEFIDAPVQSYSSGMVVRLGFAIATTLNPDILLLDEILSVGDAEFRVKCFNRIQEIIERCAVIFVSHNMSQVTRICDHLLLLDKGTMLEIGEKLGKIIANYYLLGKSDVKPIVQGSNKAKINSVKITNKKEEICFVFSNSEPFLIKINVDFNYESSKKNPKLLITFNDLEDCNVAQIYVPISIDYEIKDLMIYLEFGSMPFNTGRYWLTTSILIGDRGELACVLRRSASFIVKKNYVGYAPIILEPITRICIKK